MAESSKGRGAQSIKRIFLHDDGEPTSRAKPDTHTVVLQTLKDGKELRCSLADVFGGQLPPPSVGRAAAAFGLSTTIGNAGNSALATAADAIYEGDDRDLRREALEAVDPAKGIAAMAERWASFQAGEWSAERELGPSTALLVEAVVEYRKAHNKGTTDDQRNEYRELFKNKDEVKNHLKVAKFREIYERMRVARTLEKLGDSDADDSKLLQ